MPTHRTDARWLQDHVLWIGLAPYCFQRTSNTFLESNLSYPNGLKTEYHLRKWFWGDGTTLIMPLWIYPWIPGLLNDPMTHTYMHGYQIFKGPNLKPFCNWNDISLNSSISYNYTAGWKTLRFVIFSAFTDNWDAFT